MDGSPPGASDSRGAFYQDMKLSSVPAFPFEPDDAFSAGAHVVDAGEIEEAEAFAGLGCRRRDDGN